MVKTIPHQVAKMCKFMDHESKLSDILFLEMLQKKSDSVNLIPGPATSI